MAELTLPDKRLKPARLISDYIIMVYGPPGVGKSTFANTILSKGLFFSTDRGTRFMDRYAVEIGNWRDAKKVLKMLENQKGGVYDAYIIDHVDDLFRMCETDVCAKLGVTDPSELEWGKGWKAIRNEFTSFLMRLMRLGRGIIVIAHEDIREITTRTKKLDRIMPLLSKTAKKTLLPLVDIIGYAGWTPIKKDGKRRMVRSITFEPAEDIEAKDRTGHCPAQMELDGRKFITVFEGGKRNGAVEGRIASEGEGEDGQQKQGRRGRRSRQQEGKRQGRQGRRSQRR